MISKTEVLKRAPLWALSLIYVDMQKFAQQIATHAGYEEITLQGNEANLMQISEPDIQLILKHLNETTRCLLNYAYVNNIEDLNTKDQDYLQAKSTWDMINTSQMEALNPNLYILENYSDRSYMYCLLLWNSAHQVLLNKTDVYNETIDDFILRTDYSKYNDERTLPLFNLISKLISFEIN